MARFHRGNRPRELNSENVERKDLAIVDGEYPELVFSRP